MYMWVRCSLYMWARCSLSMEMLIVIVQVLIVENCDILLRVCGCSVFFSRFVCYDRNMNLL